MIGHIECGSTHIYYTQIYVDAAQMRRRREVEAVRSLLEHRFGAGTVIEHDANGAPLPIGRCHISVSHSHLLAVLAVDSERKIGVDAEEYRPKLRTVAPRYLSLYELAHVLTDDDYLRLWTAKEAIYKLAGLSGLSLSAGIEVLPTPRILPDCTPVILHHFRVESTLLALALLA